MLRLNDVWDIIGSIGVDLQINPKTTSKQLSLYVKTKNDLKRKLSKEQLKKFKPKIDVINQIIREIRTYIKIRDERWNNVVHSLESDLMDAKELDEIDKKLEKYKKWKLALKEGAK